MTSYRFDVDDSALVAAMSRGHPHGLDGAYRRYAGRLQAYAQLLLGDAGAAAEVVEDSFLLARWHIEELRDPQQLRPWLYALARHECLRRRARAGRLAGQISTEDADSVAVLPANHVVELVGAAMGELPPADQEIVELAVRHRLSASEIAGVLGVSIGEAHVRISRARSRFEAALGALLVARGEQLTPSVVLSEYASLAFATLSARSVSKPNPDHEPRWDPATGFPREPRNARRAITVAAAAVLLAVLLGGTMTVLARPAAQTAAQPSPTGAPAPGAQQVETATSAPGSPTPGSPTPGSPTPGSSPAPASPGVRLPPSLGLTRPPDVVAAALTVQATATAQCPGGRQVALSVAATASADLAEATLTWRVVVERTNAMTVSGRTASVTVEATISRPEITWWVQVTAKDGRTATTPAVSTPYSCPPEG
jgi:RNA polymerase sigma factor (sigma-70 family)